MCTCVLQWDRLHIDITQLFEVASFLIVSHRFSSFLVVSRRFSSFLVVSRRFSSFLIVSHHFSLGLWIENLSVAGWLAVMSCSNPYPAVCCETNR